MCFFHFMETAHACMNCQSHIGSLSILSIETHSDYCYSQDHYPLNKIPPLTCFISSHSHQTMKDLLHQVIVQFWLVVKIYSRYFVSISFKLIKQQSHFINEWEISLELKKVSIWVLTNVFILLIQLYFPIVVL
jgi:hypothetical protein